MIKKILMMKKWNFTAKVLAPMLVLLVVGCTHLGSRTLPPDRISYNKSIINSELQQLLLNMVRLRYGDTPQFLSLNNIVSQFNFQGGIAADFNRALAPAYITTTFDFAPNVSYSEAPTITYTPMQGEEFVTKLLTPIDPQIIKMFARDGWGVARILRTFIQRLGPMGNAIVASRPTSSRLPEYKEFSFFTKILRKLQWNDGYISISDTSDGTYRIHTIITRYDLLNAQEKAFLSRLGITKQTPDFWYTSVENGQPRNFMAETRTMLGIYNYLAKGVEVPKEHEKIVSSQRLPNGQLFNWQDVVGGLMDVKYSRFMPKDAYIYVYYRGYYFYIDDTDNNSKETMNLLFILNGIFQGNIQSVLPVFTVS
jgi:hypothetical protein